MQLFGKITLLFGSASSPVRVLFESALGAACLWFGTGLSQVRHKFDTGSAGKARDANKSQKSAEAETVHGLTCYKSVREYGLIHVLICLHMPLRCHSDIVQMPIPVIFWCIGDTDLCLTRKSVIPVDKDPCL